MMARVQRALGILSAGWHASGAPTISFAATGIAHAGDMLARPGRVVSLLTASTCDHRYRSPGSAVAEPMECHVHSVPQAR